MPGWLVALLVAIVGLVAGVLGTYVRIRYERGAEIRTRMLDAADEFVTAMTRAQDLTFTASLTVIGWAHAWRGSANSPMRSKKEDEAQQDYESASAAWTAANERVPRIRLLFGVDAAVSSAAERATDSLGEAVIRLAQIRGTEDEDDDLADPEGAERAHDEIDAHTKAASRL